MANKLERLHRSGVLAHRKGQRLSWYVYAVASRLLGEREGGETYPSRFLAYAADIQETPKDVARYARAYRYWLNLYLYYLDPSTADEARFLAEHNPKRLRRSLSITHFLALEETLARSLSADAYSALEQLRVAAEESTPARSLREALAGEIESDSSYDFREWEKAISFLDRFQEHLPQAGQRLLAPFLAWWSVWERESWRDLY